MKKFLLFLFLLFAQFIPAQNFETIFEKSNGTKTASYSEIINYYKKLAAQYPEINIFEIGKTDSGEPLHLVIFNSSGKIELNKLNSENKNTILINNGIHPGEPDGIDASMMLIRDIAQSNTLKEKFKNIIICVIPVYNIGGSLNRNSTSRANQNGPEEYGFRGNARNFDLNRDFIKNDTKNAKAFTKVFQLINPDVFIENHVSNGADYQYTLTHLFTQHNKLGGELGMFLNKKMMPEIEESLKSKKLIITPYVNVFNRVPDDGFSQFFDSPRYSTGYTTLFNTLGLMVETHMLKPYEKRVYGTYELMLTTLGFLNKNGSKIKELRKKNLNDLQSKKSYPISWEIDSTKTTTLNFKGFEGEYIKSEVTGLKRLKYNRSKPFSKPVVYYNYFKSNKEILIPKGYIIPQGWWKVINRLKNNNIKVELYANDTTLLVESYSITDYKTVKKPFEGHYLHYNTQVFKKIEKVHISKGDLFIPINQAGIRYLMETLEPEATDSFFNWNFFDTILQRKEGFSPYVFEDKALEILNENPKLKSKFLLKKEEDKQFNQNWYAQLNYIYSNSKNLEKAYLLYPIYRILK